MRKQFFRILKILIIVYAVIGIAVYYLQDYFIFRPRVVARDSVYQFSAPHKELNIPYAVDANMNIIQFTSQTAETRGVVLYFHGNRTNVSRYAQYADNFTRSGWEVWMIDYPGYGKSTGKRNEQQLYNWALAFYQLARARFSPDSIIIYGRSVGTGIAAQLASIRDTRYLILESPYFSFPSIFDTYLPIYPWEKIIHYQFPTFHFLPDVTAPVIIFHGTDDWTIPISNAKKLKPLLKKNDRFIVIEKGRHNDLPTFPLYQATLDSLLLGRSKK
jgi:uncharacterized protein